MKKSILSLIFIGLTFCFSQNALNFDGLDDYISTNVYGVSGNAARTIEARIRTTADAQPVNSGGTGQKVIVDWGNFVTGGRFTFNLLWNNAIRLEVGGNGLSGSIPVNDGQWHHVACVVDPNNSNTVALYVDGVLDVAGNLTVGINTGITNQIRIGARIDNTGYFDGDIDEVRIWNVAKTQTEIQADMLNELCTFPSSLVLYSPLNEGMAGLTNSAVTNTADFSQNGGNCILNNFALSGLSSNWITGFSHGAGFTYAPDLVVNACGSYFWTLNNQFYPSSTTDQAIETPSTGCASIVTLDLTISANSSSSVSVTECTSYTWPENGQTYTSSGVFYDTLPNAAGCDSILVLNLTVTGPTSTTENVSACQQYTWPLNGQTYTSSATDNITVQSTQGCDSTVFLILTISDTNAVTQNISSCGSYFWDATGTDYANSGNYSTTLTNQNGCDSTVNLNLIIVPFDNTVTTVSDNTLTANQSNAQYQWIDCATNSIIQGETNQTFVANTAGQYAVIISSTSCSDTSECINLNTASIEIETNTVHSLFPNPASDIVKISGLTEEMNKIYILNTTGALLDYSKEVNASNNTLDITALPAGLYFIRIESSTGEKEMLRLNKVD
ncbi:MAG: LamG-like jellyroll fold domain-containing protein [Lishizhenia sp.]